jgi:broad specificity polyphosphatase/5'/3'-nucleotidase SurE
VSLPCFPVTINKEEVEAKDDDEEQESEEPETVEMEIDGQLYEVPAQLKDHFLRQQDYTVKTQEVAEQRKAIEVQRGDVERVKAQYDFAQSVQPDMMKAEQLEQQAEQAHQYLRDNIDSLSSTDIEKIRLAIEDARNERTKIVDSLQTKTQEFQQAQEQSRKELLKKGTEVLRSKIPNWGESHARQVRDYAVANGFTEQEVMSVVDPRQVEVLWKASQYDTLQQGKTAAVKKVQDAPTIKAKSRNPMPKETQKALNLRKKLKNPNLSPKQKAKLMEQDFAERWA